MSKTKGRKAFFAEVAGQDVEGLYFDKALNVYYYYQIDPITNKRKKITRRNKAKAALELYNYKLLSSAKDYTKIFLYTEDDEDGGKILKSTNDKSYIIPFIKSNCA